MKLLENLMQKSFLRSLRLVHLKMQVMVEKFYCLYFEQTMTTTEQQVGTALFNDVYVYLSSYWTLTKK